MSPAEFRTERIHTGTIELNLLKLGAPDAPTIVMIHGLRDTAWALTPLATDLQQALDVQVVIIELRGHGTSERSEAYAMPNFLMDVFEVIQTLPAPVGLFGHSLGGHITYKFCALFPELIKAAMLVEGLGPPRRPHQGDEVKERANYREMLLARMRSTGSGKPIQDIQDASARLQRGNPRLSPDFAEFIAGHLVQQTEAGLQWAFDSRASSVFIDTNPDTDAKFWRGVEAPTCLVSGELSYEYWGAQFNPAEFSGRFAPGEMEQRVAQFANAEHHWFEHSGHMVHYDEPQRLSKLAIQFFSKHMTST